ncbi:MAG: hypothetical protein GX221_10025 [Candidatus Riflebacteria bacterium]|nr:hypothetical protein [Candidatus Riflebacteria bacterium]
MEKNKKNLPLLFLVTLFFAISFDCSASFYVDSSYQGRYLGTAKFEKIMADLPYVYEEALAKIQQTLGIPPRRGMNLVVIFDDKLMHGGVRLRGKRQSIKTQEGVLVHYVFLDLEFLMKGEATLLEEMTHEMTHAVMADIMGLREYEALPMWIKEGTAVHAADQGLARIKALNQKGFSLERFGSEDENPKGNPISLEKYVENYLKIKYLVETYGDKLLHRFIKRIMASGNVQRELSICYSGLVEDTLNKYSSSFIRKTLQDNSRVISATENVHRGAKYFGDGEYISARIAFTEALNSPNLPVRERQKAAYLLAECYIQERNPHIALDLLANLTPDPSIVPYDRYVFLNAYSQYAVGMTIEAYHGFKAAFENSNDKAVKEGSLYYAVRILRELGNINEAYRVLGALERYFPGSSYIILAQSALR